MIVEKPLFLISLLPFLVLLCSCHLGERTVQQRIEKNATLYKSKPHNTKMLITNGMLVPGMTRDEVFLAFGHPKHRSEGIENGVAYEEWAYQKLKPKADFEIGIGGGGLAGPKLGLDRSISKTVRFVNGRVNSFHQLKN